MSFKIQTLNKIASVGLNQLDRDNYEIASEILMQSLFVLLICTKCGFLTM